MCNKGKAITDAESGEIICSNCGIVISDKIQESNRPEWSAFSVEEMNAKVEQVFRLLYPVMTWDSLPL